MYSHFTTHMTKVYRIIIYPFISAIVDGFQFQIVLDSDLNNLNRKTQYTLLKSIITWNFITLISCIYSSYQLLVTGTRFREDGRCGPDFPLANGIPAQCDGSGGHPCCSPSGHCGSTEAHCNCISSKDYRWVITDGKC